jgi:thiosulfate/3-mercaptopyruvate sulfurtransferase
VGTYARPEVLVDTEWVARHAEDANVRLAEVDVDTYSYDEGHIPGAIGWDWSKQLCETVRRDILSKDAFERLMSASGIDPDTTVVVYGDNNNWFAAWALWQMKIYGHADVRLMNGGRRRWIEEGRPLTADLPAKRAARYAARDPDSSIRALLPEMLEIASSRGAGLVDVRSPAEFTGDLLAPPGLPETCQRGGHIPGASNVPWGKVCDEDGTFKPRDVLEALYAAEGITADRRVITYCRIGERSSHTWFVLKYLLGFPDVKNYDGSWTEWGNLINVAIEKR